MEDGEADAEAGFLTEGEEEVAEEERRAATEAEGVKGAALG